MEAHELAVRSATRSANGMVENWQISFTLPRFDMGTCWLENPLRTEADIAHLSVNATRLSASPFVRAWSPETTSQFIDTSGLWVICQRARIELISGAVTSAGTVGLSTDPELLAVAQYFVVPAELAVRTDVDCHLSVTCMN